MQEQYVNAASTTLAAAITSFVQTSIVVTSAAGFPTAPQFRILILGEIMLVTAVSGTTWTVTRNVENTQPITAPISTNVDFIFTAGALDQMRADIVSVGTYASLPAPGTNKVGDLYVPTDSFYDFLRYNGSSWDHFRNGRQLTPPDNSLFSWDNQGAATIDTTYGGVIGFSSTATGHHVRYKTAPATPYIITTAFLAHYLQSNYNTVGIGFRDSSGKLAICGVGYSTGWRLRMYKWSSATTYNSVYAEVLIPPMLVHGPIIWMQLTNDGTNCAFNVSSNGINWTTMQTFSNTDYVNASGAHQVHFCWGDIASSDVGITMLHWKEN